MKRKRPPVGILAERDRRELVRKLGGTAALSRRMSQQQHADCEAGGQPQSHATTCHGPRDVSIVRVRPVIARTARCYTHAGSPMTSVAAGMLLCAVFVQTITFSTVASGMSSQIDEPREITIRTQADWQTFWRTHSTQPVPVVDFSKSIVAGVFLGMRP